MREATSASPGRPVLANAPVCGCTFILRRLNTSLHRFPQLRSPSGQLLPPKLICIPSKMVCIAAAPATRATSHAPRLAAAGPAAHRSTTLVVRAAIADAATAKKTLKALNITKVRVSREGREGLRRLWQN